MPLGWYDYVMLGVVVLIPALQLWLAWSVRQHYDLRLSFACLAGFTLAGCFAWFVAIMLFGYSFAFCCFEGTPLKTAWNRSLFYEVMGLPDWVEWWTLPLAMFSLGLLGFALARFKFVGIATALCSIIAFAALVGWAANRSTLDTVVPEARNVPLYPGSEDAWLDRKGFSWFNWRGISFVAPASAEEVQAFYKRELPQRGWQLADQDEAVTYLEFARFETQGNMSWRFRLAMRFYKPTGSGKTNVEMDIFRLPDTQKPPLYPGAHDVQLREEQFPADFTGYVVRHTTTYTVSAQSGEVEAWYRSVLLKDDDLKEETDTLDGAEGILFSYYRDGSPSGIRAIVIIVIVRPRSDGRTSVELRGVTYPLP